MHYLPDVAIRCSRCGGCRYKAEILEVTWHGLSIADILEMTVEEASSHEAFAQDSVSKALSALKDVGLGYLTLGQPATSLSGGEAQRLKLSRLLARQTKKGTSGIVIMDEPMAGLHPHDADRIVRVLDSLVEAGQTVIVADHQRVTQVEADWIVEMGPGAGPAGGCVVSQVAPESAGGPPVS